MNETAASFLKLQLRDVLGAAFNESDFADFIRLTVPRDDFNFDDLPKAWDYKRKFWEAISWADQYAGMKGVLALAEKSQAKRPERDDLKQRVADLKRLIEGTDLPSTLSESLALARTSGISLWELAVQVRGELRKQSFAEYDLPGRFHLSEALEERLVAVLALEVDASVTYLHWLAERVTVEPLLLGFLAAKALIGCARALDRKELPRVRGALNYGLDRLNDIDIKSDSNPNGGAPFPVSRAVRGDLLRVADSLIDVRHDAGFSLIDPRHKTGLLNMPAADADEFLTALVRRFDRAAFSSLCSRHLSKADVFVSHPEDPVEVVIVHVVIQGRNIGWLPRLIWAAFRERRADGTLRRICEQFGGPEPPAI